MSTNLHGSTPVPETELHRPLVCGLQIQNFDCDIREGHLAEGFVILGTLGCFVRTSDGAPTLLSNNHIVGGENRGILGQDRILQPGGSFFDVSTPIAVLEDFVPLATSAPGATPALGNVAANVIDAAVARLLSNVPFETGYLPVRPVPAPRGSSPPLPGDRVVKVGHATGFTKGIVADVSAVVGPVQYDSGPCWFFRTIVVEGLNGTTFSDHGDSGSVVLRESTGEVVGLVYSGNSEQTFVCPIDEVLHALNCTLM